MPALIRHIEACNNLRDFAPRLPWRIAGRNVGWVQPALHQALREFPETFAVSETGADLSPALTTPEARTAALAAVAAALAPRRFLRIRRELFDVRPDARAESLAALDRGAIPAFGVIGQGVHLNGLVRRADGLHIWVGVRSTTKAVAPGQLDNVVAGGIPAGYAPLACLIKEAEEEAGMHASLLDTVRPTARLDYMLDAPEGMRRDILHVFDLDLPEDFIPRPNDDEVERFELWPAARLLECLREQDNIKFNVNLVLIDLFLREGLIDPESEEGKTLRAGLTRGQ
ncbi:DUF4743 domain-containing protein [Rhodovarius crocodyli]|uniref:DUF4743 domain-containing protein n=1 Tax=Rhodovarius crocodyli TaxID=1979269 RepID=A0A437MP84_9PROT|nr:DUF4743 domain-containing protein [Rhodovarius crocodyli]RVT99451.1 DUF4743 domain-containing protein [Rhodovarius crocodyli]